MKHYMRGLLHAWLDVTTRNARKDNITSMAVKDMIWSGWFFKWRRECLHLWKARAR